VTSMDVDSLEKAMRRTAARNLDDVGKSSVFDAVSSTSVVSNLSSVGVLLGNSMSEVDRSVDLLRKVDKSRANLPLKSHNICVEDKIDLLSPETQLGADFLRGVTEGGGDLSDPLFDVPIKMVALERKPRRGSRVKQIKKKNNFSVKGVYTQDDSASTTKLVASAGRGVGVSARRPDDEGGEIKRKRRERLEKSSSFLIPKNPITSNI
jgi:hypothetical protein